MSFEYRAGGTDVGERRRTGVSRGTIEDLPPDTAPIVYRQGAAIIAAMVTIDQVATHPELQRDYPGLTMAAGGLATPQIRRMASMGGALLQRTRCNYYRHPGFSCFKKGGTTCPSREGHHALGVVFDRSACVYPHPSTLGMALLSYEARVHTRTRGSLTMEELYGDGADPTRDHTLAPQDVLEQILLPPPLPGERAAYLRAISRFEAEWPLIEVIARLQVRDDRILFARVAVGGVATTPLRLPAVEAALLGQPAHEGTLARAAKLAAQGASPLPQTHYKVPLLEGTVLTGLEQALQGPRTPSLHAAPSPRP
jgi:xanthine dehydrogenase YagS FAD-binding subunit